MRFSTMTSLSNAPSRLTFPLPSTTVQTQRTGSVYDSSILIHPKPQDLVLQTPQSESDAKMLISIINTFAERNKGRLNICYNPKHASDQTLESYLKWLDDLKASLTKAFLDYAIVDAPNDTYALSINPSRYNRTDLNTLKRLLTKKPVL